MDRHRCIWFIAALATVLLTMTAPVFGQGSYVDPWVIQKRAAGQAVQSFNIRLGFPEETAIDFPGLHPI